MSKKRKLNENYLDNKPLRNPEFKYTTDDKGGVTIEVENKGLMNRIFQIFFKKPKISYIHLDEMGSFIWEYLNGEMTITRLGELVREHFGEKAEPLYERLAKYIQILENCNFVVLEK